VLDHVFSDAIDALSQSLERSLLERLAVEEHLSADVMLGDLTWETSYGLFGEGEPAKVRADISMVWPTWSQSSYRDWYVGDGFTEPPRIEMEVTLRIQRLAEDPDVEALLRATPDEGPAIAGATLYRAGPTVEHSWSPDLSDRAAAFEVAYSGVCELDEATLEDGGHLDAHFAQLGGWIASSLVKLNDLHLTFVPDEASEDL
jgi:hypothetical protein